MKNGDEAPTGKYTGGKGGDYKIVGNEATGLTRRVARRAWRTCWRRTRDINVVYTINEPTAAGAFSALAAAGKHRGLILVSVDGGSAGVADVAAGVIAATSQQYPVRMADLGVQAIINMVRGGEAPAVTPGLEFYNTGVT